MQQEQRLDAGDPMAFVVARAAAVEKTIADQAAEGIDGPLVPLYADRIDVSHYQDGLLRAGTCEPGYQVSAAGFELEDLGGYSFAFQD
jgi:hypothetical protein